MTPFTTDADLLPFDPRAFVDLAGVTRTLLHVVDGALDGATLTSVAGGFAAIQPGAVVVLSTGPAHAVAAAVEAVVDDNTVELAEAPVGLDGAADLAVSVRTFAAQAQQVHEQLLRSVGIDRDDPACRLTAGSILSAGLMRRLEALGTLAMAHLAAAGPFNESDGLTVQANEYRARFARALESAHLLIDTDGDGLADERRSPATGRLRRI